MHRGTRIIWLAALACFLTGCASYRPAVMPGLGDPGDPPPESAGEPIAPGDRVRVTVRGGETIEGEYVARDPASLTLVTAGPLPDLYDESSDAPPEDIQRVLPLAEIERVERYDSGGSTALLVGIGAVVVILGVVANSVSNSLDGSLYQEQ